MPGGSSTIGAGSRGTCFSGGVGSGGTLLLPGETTTIAAGGDNGGKGSADYLNGLYSIGDSAAGAGNPNGYVAPAVDDPLSNGTGGVLIVFVEGTINTYDNATKHFTANGVPGRQITSASGSYPSVFPFGGGTGGGIVIVVNNNASSLTGNIQASGGTLTANGPGGAPYRSGGNGAAVAYTFGAL